MKRIWVYANRNLKELMSDHLSLVFTIGLPLFLVIFMTTLNQRLALNQAFLPENFVPATIIFSFAFLSMFCGMLVAKDRTSSFLTRMFVSPLKSHHYILGYMIPMLMIAMIQCIILYITGLFIGLNLSIHVIISMPFLIIVSLLFISLGILFGSLFNDSQVGPVASILIQVVAFLSGMWFSLDMVGGAFKTIGYMLPFAHSVDLIRNILLGEYHQIASHLIIVFIYGLFATILAVIVFKRKMRN
jgi:ABC-2 type transport system permease protein